MKKLLNILLLLLVVNAAIAQSPQGVSYQAIARSSTGAILASQPVSLRFTIHDGSATGTVLYQETFSVTTTPLGLFSVNVGTGAPVSGSFGAINWGSAGKYLQVEMDAAGGTSYVIMGTAQQMMSVPYSLYSNNGVPNGTTAGDLLYWNGTGWAKIPAGTPGEILAVNASGIPAWSGVLLPVVATASVGSVTGTAATGGGTVTSAGGAAVTGYGICWSTTAGAESVAGAHTADGAGTGSFSSSVTGLSLSTTYYVRAYATNSLGTSYGNEVSFSTDGFPSLTTAGTTGISYTSAVSGGNVTAGGGATVTAYGVCWSTVSGTESISGIHTTDGSGTGNFSSTVTGLIPGSTYYVRAYATNIIGTAYGAEMTFTTAALTAPSITTTAATSITSTGAASGGNVTSDGGAAVTAYGVCWSTTSGTESVSGLHTTDGSGTGSFASSVSGLAPGTTYYAMAYATNSVGTAYGTEISFTTNAVIPTLATTSISSITSSTAAGGGNVTASGGAAVTAYGICWSTTLGSESVSGTHTTDGSGTGSFSSSIAGLAPGTTYYVMAYATNSVGTAYGTEVSFTTNAVIPSLNTTTASSVTYTSAISGGNVTATGGASVTAYGVCWSATSGSESVSGAHTTDGSGTGSFTSNLSGLTPGTTYYVMAYATNSAGTAYGSEISFTTTALTAPALTTAAASSITSSGAVSGGNVTSDGGATVTAYGVCWSTTSGAESVAGSHTTDGSSTGTFTSTISGLATSTTYYVEAYATNSVGTTYGSEITFTTASSPLPVIVTDSITGISSTSFTAYGRITSIGGAPVTDRGFVGGFSSGLTLSTGYVLPTGSGPGSFDTTISTLTASSTLYVKAYATNSFGTVYGSEISFTTLPAILPTAITDTVSSITSNSGVSGCSDPSDGGDSVTARGVCWSTISGSESVSGAHTTNGGGRGHTTDNMTGLSPATTYYVKAYATNAIGTAYGSEVSFTTSASTLATIVTDSVYSVTYSSFFIAGRVISEGGARVTSRGFVGAPFSGATLTTGAVLLVGAGPGSYDTGVLRASAGTTLFVKSFATNSYGTVYGNEISFTTPLAPLPTVTTNALSSITSSSAQGGGTDTGYNITGRGVCWSTTPGAESISGAHTTDGGGNGTWVSSITGLSAGVTYYVMAYSTNSTGTVYGSERSFTTNSVPAVTTTTASSITATSATSGGNVTASGGLTVTAHGVCWSTIAGAESVTGSHINSGSGTGSFISSITGLSANTTYYVKAYATNSLGTAYGSEINFTTPTAPPTLTRGFPGTATTTTETVVSNDITADGGTAITAYGVCWSTTSGGESLSTSFTNDYPGGSYSLPIIYTSTITGLSPSTLYYVKTYATNGAGTTFGTETAFVTAAVVVPTISTAALSGITTSGVTSGGNVTASGGATVTAYGVCWGTTPGAESVSGSHTTDGTGTGTFTSNITGLSSGTTYYVKAYATNSAGTGYGGELIFTTSPLPSVTMGTLGTPATTSETITGNGIIYDGGSGLTAYGVCWSTSPGGESLSGSHTNDYPGGSYSLPVAYSSTMTGLSLSTTYYVKAYATNSSGTTFSSESSFTTANGAPVVSGSGSSPGHNSGSFFGNITSDGSAPLTAYGFIYSTTPGGESLSGANLNLFGSSSYIGGYSYSFTMGGVTTYYAKAYATNSFGTTFSSEFSITIHP